MVFLRAACYPEGMDALGFSLTNQIALIIAPHAAQAQMLELAAQLAVQGGLRALDCGNRFNIYPVGRAIRRRTTRVDETLERIILSRAFTCYQVLALLEESPEESIPTLVLDLLATFYDEDVKLPESRRLLGRCLLHLQRLSRQAPVVVSACPPKAMVYAERIGLLETLRDAASVLWEANMEEEDLSPLPPAYGLLRDPLKGKGSKTNLLPPSLFSPFPRCAGEGTGE